MKLRRMPSALLASSLAFCVPAAVAQESVVSLADLARQARERKRAVANPAPVIVTLDKAKSCGREWDCLLEALEAREPASLRLPDIIDLSETSGVTITSDVLLEIHDCQEETCRLTGRTENSTVRIADGTRARLLLRGLTPEEVNERERNAQAMVKPQDEARVHCVFQIDRLRYFLEQRKQGHTAGQDWELADRCEGLDQIIANPFTDPAP